MTEKLYRHIAESDPYVVANYGKEFCFYCYLAKRLGHAPDCWYVWCCEWVEKQDNLDVISLGCEVCDGAIGYVKITGNDFKCPNCGCILSKADEQNTGDEDRSYPRQEWWFGD